jgi:CRISPR/Cas system-associated endonuclease Cas1
MKCYAGKVDRALVNAKLELFLGFLHSTQYGKTSPVCDFQELYRYLIIQYCVNFDKKNFVPKAEELTRKKKSKREYLNDNKTTDLSNKLNSYFERSVDVRRKRGGRKQTMDSLINEEAWELAKYLRNERENWIPRIGGVLDTSSSR